MTGPARLARNLLCRRENGPLCNVIAFLCNQGDDAYSHCCTVLGPSAYIAVRSDLTTESLI